MNKSFSEWREAETDVSHFTVSFRKKNNLIKNVPQRESFDSIPVRSETCMAANISFFCNYTQSEPTDACKKKKSQNEKKNCSNPNTSITRNASECIIWSRSTVSARGVGVGGCWGFESEKNEEINTLSGSFAHL